MVFSWELRSRSSGLVQLGRRRNLLEDHRPRALVVHDSSPSNSKSIRSIDEEPLRSSSHRESYSDTHTPIDLVLDRFISLEALDHSPVGWNRSSGNSLQKPSQIQLGLGRLELDSMCSLELVVLSSTHHSVDRSFEPSVLLRSSSYFHPNRSNPDSNTILTIA